MNYCPDCAVAVKGDHPLCPLCGSPLQESRPEVPADVLARPELRYEGVAERVRKRPWIIALVTAGVVFVPAAISLIVDLLINQRASWSILVVGALGLLFLYISMPSLVFYLNAKPGPPSRRRARRRRRFWLLMLLNALATWGYLLYVDQVDADHMLNWAVDFGGLLTLATLGVIMAFFYTLQPPGSVRRGPLLFLWMSAYVVIIDALVSSFLLSGEYFGWGLIVAASLVPLGALYWIIEYLVSHSDRVRRRLHV